MRSTDVVIDTFEAAPWALALRDGFAPTVLRAVNLGDDADTVGAVAGQLAGAACVLGAIPPAWRATLAWHGHLIAPAARLNAPTRRRADAARSRCASPRTRA